MKTRPVYDNQGRGELKATETGREPVQTSRTKYLCYHLSVGVRRKMKYK